MTYADYLAQQEAEAKLDLLIPQMQTAKRNQRETTEIISHMTDEISRMLENTKINMDHKRG